jgi:hypothetical protein
MTSDGQTVEAMKKEFLGVTAHWIQGWNLGDAIGACGVISQWLVNSVSRSGLVQFF